jgi:GGDEF domain-containing protein
MAARCLVEAVEKVGLQSASFLGQSFVGHVGGDDFVLIAPADRAEDLCKDIIARFDAAVPALYDPEDRARGYIAGKTRQGQPINFPFVGIALVIVSHLDRKFTHPGEISAHASEMKTVAKASGKSAYVMDRRRAPPAGPV